MNWKNSPPVFSTATDTIANLSNQRIHSPLEPEVHQLDDKAEAASFPEVKKRPAPSSSINTTLIPVAQDPSLPEMYDPLSCIDVYVDDFAELAQTTLTAWRVCKILLHAIDDVFYPLDPSNAPF